MARLTALLIVVAAVLSASACGDEGSGPPEGGAGSAEAAASGAKFPELLSAEATQAGDGTYDIAVTISSPYDSPARYANGWRVIRGDGEVIAEHELLHDHASEQPFTRVQTGVEIDESVGVVQIEGRDLANGYGGTRLQLRLP